MKTGMQFYSLSQLVNDGQFEAALELAAHSGVDGIELYSHYQVPAITYRKALNGAGIVCYGSHNYLEALSADLGRVMEYNYIVGNPAIICHYLKEDERGTRDRYLRVAERFNDIAATLKRNGFQFLYHNHDFEFSEKFGEECGLDLIVANTEPQLVGLELHIGQLGQFGLDEAEYMKKLGRRVKMLHVHMFTKTEPEFNSGPAIAYGRELDILWAVLENVYPLPIDSERVKRDVAAIRAMAHG
jgi:sugar phosphate isomerase/epimerase